MGVWVLLGVVCGHELPDGVIERGVQVVVRSDRVELQYDVGLNANTARAELQRLGVQPPDDVSVFTVYRKLLLPELAAGLHVRLDGVRLDVQPTKALEVRRHHARIQCRYQAALPPLRQRHELVVRDDNFPYERGGRRIALKARDGITVVESTAPQLLGRQEAADWDRLTPAERERTRRVAAVIAPPDAPAADGSMSWRRLMMFGLLAVAALRALCAVARARG